MIRLPAREALRSLASVLLCLWGARALPAAAAEPPEGPEIVTIDRADAVFAPRGLPTVARTGVDLLRRWDLDFPGRDGAAVYTVVLPRRVGDAAMAVLFSRVGNQVAVSVNGTPVQHWGRLGDADFDAAKIARRVVLPAALLRADRDNAMRVEVTAQQQRWGGLSALRYGPEGAIEALYDEQIRWRYLAVLVYGWSLAAMAALAAALWWRQRDPLFGCFALAAFFGVVRDLDRLWPALPVPWPAWGAIEAGCYALHLVLIARFALLAGSRLPAVMRRANNAVAGLTVALAAAGFMARLPGLWTVALGSLIPLGAASFAMVVVNAVRSRDRAAWALPIAGGVAVLAGIHDFMLIRLSHSSGFRIQLTPPAMFVFVLVMAAIVVRRYNRSVADHRALDGQLVQRIEDRERQLRAAFDALREKERQQSVAEERQRIMQDIHDGVGSHLVGLLQLVRAPGADHRSLTQHVIQALDEMRIAVDSLQPAQDELVTVLATLRHRLEPRLKASGIALVWQVSDLPALLPMAPDTVRQVQRIVLEAITNVLKHADASRVVVETSHRRDPAAAVVRISDNGRAVTDLGRLGPGARSKGRGLSGMRRRAEAIGASISFEAEATGGVSVTLALPAPAPA